MELILTRSIISTVSTFTFLFVELTNFNFIIATFKAGFEALLFMQCFMLALFWLRKVNQGFC